MNFDRIIKRLEPSPTLIDIEIAIRIIKAAVIDAFQIDELSLSEKKRDAVTTLARQIVMYLSRQLTDASLNEIGMELGDRTPATISWGYQRIAGAFNENPGLYRKVIGIRKKVEKSFLCEVLTEE